jgi:hypothetical protein
VEFTVPGAATRWPRRPACSPPERLDPGTAVLLRKADLPTAVDDRHLLDLGCGYGPIACVLASEAPDATVYADRRQRPRPRAGRGERGGAGAVRPAARAGSG